MKSKSKMKNAMQGTIKSTMKKLMMSVVQKYCCVVVLILSSQAFAEFVATDFRGRKVVLEQPARRIVALAPHIVENLYSAGAGNYVVGAVDYCDYPEAAKKIPRVGAISAFSLEAILELQPDLVVVWHSGRGAQVMDKLLALNIPVYASDPRSLAGVAKSIRDYGRLAGTYAKADAIAAEYEVRHQALTTKYAKLPPVGTLYQVWNSPIQTLNDKHIISDVIRLCGGVNVFGDALAIAPKLSVESVIVKDPEVIIASGMGEARPDWLDEWKQWTSLKAVKDSNLYYVPPDIIQRHTVRILDGAALMCEHLQQARKKR